MYNKTNADHATRFFFLFWNTINENGVFSVAGTRYEPHATLDLRWRQRNEVTPTPPSLDEILHNVKELF
jgi:hypothetical protein